jgi:hypothetical protein
MSAKCSSLVLVLALVSAIPASAHNKKKDQQRAMLQKMEAVPCGANQKGLSGLGSFWASVGITHMSSSEKLCPQYLVLTDQMEYEIRPTDLKHAVILPVGHEAVIRIKKDHMLLRVVNGDDRKTRSYEVVAINPNPTYSGGTNDRPSNDGDDH